MNKEVEFDSRPIEWELNKRLAVLLGVDESKISQYVIEGNIMPQIKIEGQRDRLYTRCWEDLMPVALKYNVFVCPSGFGNKYVANWFENGHRCLASFDEDPAIAVVKCLLTMLEYIKNKEKNNG